MKYCSVPFTTLYIYHYEYTTCCASWLDRSCVVPVNPYRSPDEIWHGTEFAKLREAWAKGDESLCTKCPLLATNDKNVFKESSQVPQAPSPTRIYLANEESCNLHCWTCRAKPKGIDALRERREADMVDIIWRYRKDLEWLSLLHTGELFASPMHLRLLSLITEEEFPKLRIELFTNGILLPSNWPNLASIHKLVKQVTISIDAASGDVYEQVRAPARWVQLLKTMEFVRELIHAGLIERFQCNFVVRRKNKADVGPFVDFCRSYGATSIRYSIFDKTWMSAEEYAAEALTAAEYAEIVQDDRLDLPGVNANILRAAASGKEIMA